MTTLRRAAIFGLLGVSLPACGGDIGTAETDEISDGVQVDYAGFEGQQGGYFSILFGESMSDVGKSVGAIRTTRSDGAFGQCGATFLSPQYALTSAHCIPTFQVPLGTAFKVEQVNTSGLGLTALAGGLHVTGTWPSWTRSDPMTASEGYLVTSYTDCKVVVGCDSANVRTVNNTTLGTKACPFTQEVDVALIRCPSRASNSTYGSKYVLVHDTDKSNAQLDVWWFHELLKLATDPGGYNTPTDNWLHYGLYPTSDPKDNYHYRVSTHQMLPLRSRAWPTGIAYKQLNHVVDTGNPNEITNTDVPICHGTSGSGVFERGTTGVFGPVAVVGTDSATNPDRLCEDMLHKSPGMSLMHHIRRSWSAQLEAMSIVQSDRP